MKSTSRLLLSLVVIAIIVAAVFLWKSASVSKQVVGTPSPQPAPTTDAAPPIQYPIDTSTVANKASAKTDTATTTTPTLPAHLTFEEALSDLFGQDAFKTLFKQEDLLHKIVVTIEDAPQKTEPTWEFWPLKSLHDSFTVDKAGDAITISETNFKRYKPYVDLADRLDVQKLTAIYVRFYPDFQKMYDDFGTHRYFNDRVVQVIDNLLATPDVKGPIALIKPAHGRFYKYADGQLEKLSAGQKMLIRMGADNAAVVKAKLRAIRAAITHRN